ncbi:hypothetical protein AB0N59_08670 [Microbacterium sp. NPDC089321]|uniref:hypothetical protein n=1 Tax=Microbacterium sp. NPDC089321 TaxID=3155183 RepID=UPI0034281EC4
MSLSIRVVAHDELNRNDLAGLRKLFDAEYRSEYGDWHPDPPYGYAPHDVHVIVGKGATIVRHVGWARRSIGTSRSSNTEVGVQAGTVVRRRRISRCLRPPAR